MLVKDDMFNWEKKELEASKRIGELEIKVQEVRFKEKIVNEGFHYDVKGFSQPITKPVSTTIEEIIEQFNAEIETIEDTVKNIPANTIALANTKTILLSHCKLSQLIVLKIP